jgi:hypothetical protein
LWMQKTGKGDLLPALIPMMTPAPCSGERCWSPLWRLTTPSAQATRCAE